MLVDAVVVSAARTAIGTARKGTLVDVSAFDLVEFAIGEALRRAAIPARGRRRSDPRRIAPGRRRHRPLRRRDHGISRTFPGGDEPPLRLGSHRGADRGRQHPRRHGSSVVIAGGTESLLDDADDDEASPGKTEPSSGMSPSHPETPQAPRSRHVAHRRLEHGADGRREPRGDGRMGVPLAPRGRPRATDDGRFAEEILPDRDPGRKGRRPRPSTLDEHPRRETHAASGSRACSRSTPEIEGFSITAGNSSGINDGAAALVVVDSEYARAHGLKPLAIIKSWALGRRARRAGTGLAPTLAIPKALARAGLTTGDIDLCEINEAFCSMAVACSASSASITRS